MDLTTLTVLAGRPDIRFLPLVLRHIAGSYPFAERILVIDTLPPTRRQRARMGGDTLPELLRVAAALKAEGTIARVLDLGTIDCARTDAVHFGRRLPQDRDYRGIPLRGWTAGIDAAETRYLVHFDSDILLFQQPGFRWIDAGIDLLNRAPEVMFVAPHPGPPRPDGALPQQAVPFTRDPRGFFGFKTFSSRRFLIDRERFKDLLPATPTYFSTWRRLRSAVTGESAVMPWESIVSVRLEASRFLRAHLNDARAWSLHPPDHSPAFVEALPALLRRIEVGEFPSAQAGRYDLDLRLWACPS